MKILYIISLFVSLAAAFLPIDCPSDRWVVNKVFDILHYSAGLILVLQVRYLLAWTLRCNNIYSCLFICIGGAFLVELVQLFVGRTPSLTDFLISVSGFITGVALIKLTNNYSKGWYYSLYAITIGLGLLPGILIGCRYYSTDNIIIDWESGLDISIVDPAYNDNSHPPQIKIVNNIWEQGNHVIAIKTTNQQWSGVYIHKLFKGTKIEFQTDIEDKEGTLGVKLLFADAVGRKRTLDLKRSKHQVANIVQFSVDKNVLNDPDLYWSTILIYTKTKKQNITYFIDNIRQLS